MKRTKSALKFSNLLFLPVCNEAFLESHLCFVYLQVCVVLKISQWFPCKCSPCKATAFSFVVIILLGQEWTVVIHFQLIQITYSLKCISSTGKKTINIIQRIKLRLLGK